MGEFALDPLESSVVEGPLTPESLTKVAIDLMAKAGWSDGEPPQFAFDILDDDEDNSAGWLEGATCVIHLHPRLLHWPTILHELAHFIDGRDGHGPRFCGTYVGLVGAQFGESGAASFLSFFKEVGVDVDEEWAFLQP